MRRALFLQKPMIQLLLAALVLSLNANTAVSAADTFAVIFKNADDKYGQGSYQDALKLYNKACGMKKNDFECLWKIALTQNRLGQYSDALKTTGKLMKISKSNNAQLALCWNLRGRTLFDAATDEPDKLNSKSILKSEFAFREALRTNPVKNLARYNLGVLLIRTNRTDEGLAELRTYLTNAEDPDIAEQARMIISTPKIPVPILELVKSVKTDFPDGFRYNHTIRINNLDVFPAELFKASQSLPPCTLGAAPTATGTRMEITVMDDTPLRYPPMCRITEPQRLRQLTVVSQLIYRSAEGRVQKPKAICVRIKDRLTGNYVYSETVALPKY